jgi:hypothetical protein
MNSSDISVVSFDFDGEACSLKQILTSQADEDMASLVLDPALVDQGKDINVNVGYVNDLNFAPLLKRNDVWEAYKAENNWTQLFFVENAANFSLAETLQLTIEQAIEGTSPQVVDFICAP